MRATSPQRWRSAGTRRSSPTTYGRCWPCDDGSYDFLDPETYHKDEFDHVITNPPYSKAQEFVERALEVAKSHVAMLLRIQFLESVKRYEFFKLNPPKWVFVFSSRIAMYPEGEENRGGGTQCFAWFVWEKYCYAHTQIQWFDPDLRRYAP